MKRRVMTLSQIWDELSDYDKEYWGNVSVGICALVSVENMGFCKDGETRWYTFTDNNGNPAIYFKPCTARELERYRAGRKI